MSGKTPRSTLGLQDHQMCSDCRNTILVGIWDRNDHLDQHQHADTRVGVVRAQNDTLLCLMLDHSEERCQQAQIRVAAYQQQIRVAHHTKEFHVGDLVLKCMIQSTR